MGTPLVKKSEDREAVEEEELKPLDQEEIDIAEIRIKELHPLYELKLYKLLPCLCCCTSLYGRD